MRRLLVAALLTLAALEITRLRAGAVTEYCPASIFDAHPFASAGALATLWSFDLSGLGPRSVRGDVLAETSAGWYTFEFPEVALTEHTIRIESPNGRSDMREFISPAVYVEFPHSVSVTHWWVSDALTSRDQWFNWDRRGVVTCPPVAAGGAAQKSSRSTVTVTPAIDLLRQPGPGDTIVSAEPTAAPSGVNSCAVPFADAQAVSISPLDFPESAQEAGVQLAGVVVLVAISAHDTIDDAWVAASSGLRQLDDEVLRAARQTTYRSGIAMCHPVPGTYRFIGVFSGAGP